MDNFIYQVKRDLFNISKRISQIDREYKIYYSKKTKKYFVTFKNSYAFNIGTKLTSFALKKAYLTHIRRSKQILTELEMSNEKLQKKEQDLLRSKNISLLNDMLEYADKKGEDLTFNNINKTKWI